MFIDVCITPNEIPAELNDVTVLVIDVLRATSCIATAFANGCEEIHPVRTIEEALDRKKEIGGEVLLCGERQGVCIPNFHFGNSPFEYVEDKVKGKSLIMTTTNGTMALAKTIGSRCIYTASFLNAQAICCQIRDVSKLLIVCSGTDGRIAVEDCLCAGLIVDRILDVHANLSDRALMVYYMYKGTRGDIKEAVWKSSHARYLSSIGFGADVEKCLELDLYDVVPIFSGYRIHI